jgi:ABC-type glycerol-3-phosphate transport system permease component
MATQTVPQPSQAAAKPASFLQSRRTLAGINAAVSYLLLVIGSVLILIPFFWMVSSALKPDYQIFVFPPQWIPNPVQWQNFAEALTALPFHIYFRNTLIIEVGVIVGTLLSCSIVAYGFARLNAPGRDFWFVVLLSTMMLPSVVTMIPVYLIFRQLGWINTHSPLIVPSWFGSAFYIFLLRQFL